MKAFAIVCSGGLFGGVFWLLTQIVGANTLALSPAVYLYATIGGIIAAGVAIYIASNADVTKLGRIFFISAVAGLSFPSVISTATNAKDVAQIQGTNRQVQQNVQAIQQQIASPVPNATQVAQDIKQAGTKLNSNPASADVKLSFDTVSKTAIDSLSAKAQNSNNPNSYVKAIEQIGSVPQLHSEATSTLVQLANSNSPEVSAIARPALTRLTKVPVQFNDGVAAAATSAKSHQ